MLQVPCLSPPIYGHSHYKKFWLREATIGSGDLMKSAETNRPVKRKNPKIATAAMSSSPPDRMIVDSCPVDEITLSTEDHKCFYDCAMRDDDEDEEIGEEIEQGHEQEEEEEEEQHEQHVLEEDIRRSSSNADDQAAVDCLTSKCEDSRHVDQEEEEDAEDQDEDSSSSEEEATSSASQASEFEKSATLTRQFKRRHSTKSKDESGKNNVLPKTRSAAAAAMENFPSRSGSAAGNGSNNGRTCTVCGTMKTPLWRNGPQGPKSLCNACGIRMRKAKRGSPTEAGSSGGATVINSATPPVTMVACTSTNGNTSGNTPSKRKSTPPQKTTIDVTTAAATKLPYKKSRMTSFSKRDLEQIRFLSSIFAPKAGKSFAKDEEEGAVLLMAMSCGLCL